LQGEPIIDKLSVRSINTGEKAMEYDQRHGGPYDRGSADAYYRREYAPHYFKGDTYNSERVPAADMSAAEIVAYTVGFTKQTESGDFKDWGSPYAHASRDMGEEIGRAHV
jgi:hypothetical protein